jgi:hypothetical protein
VQHDGQPVSHLTRSAPPSVLESANRFGSAAGLLGKHFLRKIEVGAALAHPVAKGAFRRHALLVSHGIGTD